MASEDVVSEAKVTIMKIKINTKTTISGIDLHWNYQKQRSPVSIYAGTIKNTYLRYRSTLELSKTHISGIDLHWNYQKHISIHFWVIYWRTTSTKILTINKHMYQTIVVSTGLSHPWMCFYHWTCWICHFQSNFIFLQGFC